MRHSLNVVLIMAFVSGKQYEVKKIAKRELGFIGLSGLATGASWLCNYRALQLVLFCLQCFKIMPTKTECLENI